MSQGSMAHCEGRANREKQRMCSFESRLRRPIKCAQRCLFQGKDGSGRSTTPRGAHRLQLLACYPCFECALAPLDATSSEAAIRPSGQLYLAIYSVSVCYLHGDDEVLYWGLCTQMPIIHVFDAYTPTFNYTQLFIQDILHSVLHFIYTTLN